MLHSIFRLRPICSVSVVRAAPVMYVNVRTYKSRTQQSFDDGIDLTQQTFEVNPIEHIRRCSLHKDLDIWTSYKTVCPNARTLGDVLYEGYNASNDGPCVGILPSSGDKQSLEWLSYSAAIDRSRSIGSYLWETAELTPMQSKVAIISSNRPEYLFVEQACYMYGFILVNLYTSYEPTTILSLLNRTQSEILVVDNLDRIKSIEKDLLKNGQIKQILVMDEIVDNENKKIRSISSIVKTMNKGTVRERPSVDPDSIATFIMTSGTTGEPKIVMLSHENLLAATKGNILRMEKAHINRSVNIRHCSVLPMAHVLERFILLSGLLRGLQVVFCPETEKLIEYFSLVKPTQIIVVPRILNKVYDTVIAEASKNQLKLFLVQQALRRKQSWWLSRLVFRKVKNLFGGEVLLVITGAAPITSEVMDFTRVALDAPVVIGYGQTESAACGTTTHVSDTTNGKIGTPCTTSEIKLIDVPGTSYRSEMNQGEICVRGPTIFKGYFNDEASTREAIDEKGWLRTGDVAELTDNGTLRIIDRTKHIFKLAQGSYIAPEHLEVIYIRSRWVAQIFIDGISTEATVVAIVVPDEEYVRKNFKPAVAAATFADLCKDHKLKEIIMLDLIHLAKENRFKYFEIPSNIHLHPDPFSMKNDLLTVTLKTRRTSVRKNFAEILQSLYKTDERPTNNP